MEQDAGHEAVSSPTPPGTGKSKLDTLPKEELIKFAKKQVFLLQKVKSKCTELEKELEELKSKPLAGGNEDVIQDTIDNMVKQQEQWEELSTDHLKKIDCLKKELERLNSNHTEEVCTLQQKLKESADQMILLEDKLALQSNREEEEVKTLQKKLEQQRSTYEEHILNLNKQVEALTVDKNIEIRSREECEKADLIHHQREIGDLRKELLKLKSFHQEEICKLICQLQTHGEDYEEERQKVKQFMHEISEHYLSKEKSLQEELHQNKVKNEQEIFALKGTLNDHKENLNKTAEGQNLTSLETETQDKMNHLEYVIKNYESQQSILKDELTYTNNVRLKLELEVQHMKDEFFHEREDLEFKINELQLAKEDYSCLIEKLQLQLKSGNEDCEVIRSRHNQEVLVLRDQHKKEMSTLKEKIMSSSEQETSSLMFEINVLKDKCDGLLHEKEEAVAQYEGLKETLVILQDELGESAGKISREFKALKQQQATDVQELQQKLRSAYNEKDVLLETVNKLKAEVEGLSAKQAECEDLVPQINVLQKYNDEMMVSLEQKNALLIELEEQIRHLSFQNNDIRITLEASREEIVKVRNMCEMEQAQALGFQQKSEAVTKDYNELKLQREECMEKLKETITEKDQIYQKLAELEERMEGFMHEKEKLLSDAQALNNEVLQLREEKEQLQNLQNKLQLVTVAKEDLNTLYENEQQQKILNEEKLSSEIKALHVQIGKLLQEKETMSRDFEMVMSEKDGSLVIKEQIEKLENKLKLAIEEKAELSKLLETNQHVKLINEENPSTKVQALLDTVETLCEEKEKMSSDIESFMAEREAFVGIKEKCEMLQNKLQLVIVEKDEMSMLYEKDQKQKLINEGNLSSEIQALHSELGRLMEENERMTIDIDRFVTERDDLLVIKNKVESLENKLQFTVEANEELSKLYEKDQQQKLLITSHLRGCLVQMGSMPLDEDKENTINSILQAVDESIARLKDEHLRMVTQSDERYLLLQQDMERLQEENEAHCAELRSLIEDYAQEQVVLKKELEATLSEKEGLQRDLLEMKSANEKARQENLDLLARMEEVTKKLECPEIEAKEQPPEAAEENLAGLLEQKESDLCNLKAEFTFLKDSVDKSMAVESDQQVVITELQMKIVNLEKLSKDREEKLNKFKAVAIKAKKELDSSRKEVQTLKEELELVKSEKSQLSTSIKDLIQGAESYKNLLAEYDRQAEQLDVSMEQAEYSGRKIEELTRQLEAVYQKLDKFSSEKEDLLVRVETLQTNTRLLEAQILEMQRAKVNSDKELEAEKLLKEQKIKDHIGALKQLEDVQIQLQKEKKQFQVTMHELELLRKDAQKNTLMDMEIADYDRLVRELNQKMSDKNSKLEDLEQEIRLKKQREETLNEEITSLQASVEQYEERSTKMKQLLVKTKKELADSKQAETDNLLLQASLKGELEAIQQQGESFKIQVAELTAEKHRIQEQLRAYMEQQQRTTNAYQQKIASLQDAYSMAKADQAAVTAEYEGYKVRVHNVFKQQKNKSSSQIENEAAKQEREHLEMMLEQLKNKLQDSQHNLQINMTELQTLQTDHDTLLERHNKMLQETVAKEAELREKLCSVQSENMVMKSEHAQILSQLTAQNEALRNSFRDQVRHMQEDHRKTMEMLQQQLSKLEGQLFQQKSEFNIITSSSQPPLKTLRERRAADMPLIDMYISTREEGEGMETIDTDSVSSASTYLPPLEQLLNSPEAKFEPPEWQPELSKEELVQKLNTTTKSIDHLNELLHETEATNAILMEQITLLKNEVRRLERNQEREKSVNNLEYLKNVLLQFIFLKAGSERQRLLPVIDTMLHLSPEEKGKLVAIALGEEEAAGRPAGWASYLHSWSGLR
ncbi:GRIP and coiled-coil domain-containing protein 2 isoform X2 [Ambystoma mexicanum]|uniref:GRIP and coiled-coil domain-containing protein 2 isoform X2 n=1 Tax=Ambystoma mexicanum TaxID=8296 RepID=UPI0037E8EA6B